MVTVPTQMIGDVLIIKLECVHARACIQETGLYLWSNWMQKLHLPLLQDKCDFKVEAMVNGNHAHLIRYTVPAVQKLSILSGEDLKKTVRGKGTKTSI